MHKAIGDTTVTRTTNIPWIPWILSIYTLLVMSHVWDARHFSYLYSLKFFFFHDTDISEKTWKESVCMFISSEYTSAYDVYVLFSFITEICGEVQHWYAYCWRMVISKQCLRHFTLDVTTLLDVNTKLHICYIFTC